MAMFPHWLRGRSIVEDVLCIDEAAIPESGLANEPAHRTCIHDESWATLLRCGVDPAVPTTFRQTLGCRKRATRDQGCAKRLHALGSDDEGPYSDVEEEARDRGSYSQSNASSQATLLVGPNLLRSLGARKRRVGSASCLGSITRHYFSGPLLDGAASAESGDG